MIWFPLFQTEAYATIQLSNLHCNVTISFPYAKNHDNKLFLFAVYCAILMSQHDVVLNSAIEHKPYFYVNIADIDTLESEMSYVACEYHSCPSALRVCSGYFMVFLWC